MKICRERAELDLMKGRQTWPVRYMLIDLALYSGLRVGEMAAIQIGDIVCNEQDPYIIVRKGKGNKKRTVFIYKKLAKHLKEFINYKSETLKQAIDKESPLFCGWERKHSPPITLMKSFKVAIKEAGLPHRYLIHKFRHTYATFLLHNTANLRYVMQQLGHSYMSMTLLYANIIPEENG